MEIAAEDGGGLAAPANARVNVSVVGGSVASPLFEQAQYFFTVPEDVLRGTPLGVVRASAKTGELSGTRGGREPHIWLKLKLKLKLMRGGLLGGISPFNPPSEWQRGG